MKLLYSILFIIFCANALLAQNTLFIDTTSSGPNETMLISVKINNEKPFTAFQLDIALPAVLQYANNSASLADSRKLDHQVSTSVLTNNVLRLIAFSSSGKNFTGDSGTVVTFSCNAKQMPGSYQLSVSNVIVSDTSHVNILNNSFNGLYSLLAPLLSVDQTIYDFGSLALGQNAERILNITNTGNLPLVISSLSSNLGEIRFSDSSTVTIAASQTISRAITFVPVKKGNKNGSLTIASNSSAEPSRAISVKGYAYAVNEIHLGTVQGRSGYEGSLRVLINNMEAFSAFEFTVNLPQAMTYKVGSAQLFRQSDHQVVVNTFTGNKLKVVVYSPLNKSFAGTSGDVLQVDFNLNGTGGYYAVDISDAIIADTTGANIISASYNGSLQIASPVISFSTTQINYGSISILDTANTNLTITNNGNDTLKIASIKFDSNLFYTTSMFPITILPYNSSNLPILFHSGVKGNYSAKLTLDHNDYVRNPSVINLTATAFAPNILSTVSTAGVKNDTIMLSFKIRNTESFTAFQFDVTLPQGLDLIANSISLGQRATANHSISYSLVTPTKIRILAYSINQSLFSSDSGVVCSFKVKLSGNYGNYTVAIENGIIGNVNNQNILTSMLNGTVIVFPNSKISGRVLYNNSANAPLPSVQVFLKNGNVVSDSTVTDINGNFVFKNVYDGNYQITAKSDKPINGITSTDALLIRRYTVGLIPLTALQLQAADVNASGIVNSTDALQIRRFVVGQISSFPKSGWVFESPNVTVNGNDVSKVILGNVVGDVNGSFSN
ncbi:MAG: choice-of-anchor D domain-containing protein [Ignavibacteriaceae bacterium]|jgi:hypothetical protein